MNKIPYLSVGARSNNTEITRDIYLSTAVPNANDSGAGQKYKTSRLQWRGLNLLSNVDSGYLSNACNITMNELPYLAPTPNYESYKTGYTVPISLFAFDDFLVVIYRQGGAIKLDYITKTATYTGTIKPSGATTADDYQRSIVKFNVYTTPQDPLSGTYDQKLLIFPDKLSMDFKITSSPVNLSELGSTFPNIRYATVFLSRLFGVDDTRIYASGFNDYTFWDLDTAEESGENNAWVSPAQSNTKADGVFTGITTYGGHVMAFKRDYTHELYNNKNPFRIQDLFSEGAVDNRSIQEVNGLLFFVSENKVIMYNGGSPRQVSAVLDIGRYETAISGTWGNNYYLYTQYKDHNVIFVYNVSSGEWTKDCIENKVIQFASNDNGIYALFDNGVIYKLNTSNFADRKWFFETEVFLNGTVDNKRIIRLQSLAEFAEGSKLRIRVFENGEEYSETHIADYSHTQALDKSGKRAIRVPIKHAEGFIHKIRFEGTGYVKIYTLELIIQTGGVKYGDTNTK